MHRSILGAALLILVIAPRADAATVGLFADPWGRLVSECAPPENEMFEIYLIASDFEPGEGMDVFDLQIEGLEESGLTAVWAEYLVGGETLTEFLPPNVLSFDLVFCAARTRLARIRLLVTEPLTEPVELSLGGNLEDGPIYRDCTSQVQEFDLDAQTPGRPAPGSLMIEPNGTCCPVVERGFVFWDGHLSFPPSDIRMPLVFEEVTQDDELQRITCGDETVHGVRGTVRFDATFVDLVELDTADAGFDEWDATTTDVEAGVVAFEMRDPGSEVGIGAFPISSGSSMDVVFRRVEGVEATTEVVIDGLEVCVSSSIDEPGSCMWQAVDPVQAQILVEVAGEVESFGTVKARFEN